MDIGNLFSIIMKIIDLIKKYLPHLDHLDIELLISHVLKKTREFVLAHPEYILNKKQVRHIERLLQRRTAHEPFAYITGHKEFYSLDFKVNRHTLIPRPETELLVEEILRTDPTYARIIDVGTGSGNIIISLAKHLHSSNQFFAVDISPEALRVARSNARAHGVQNKIQFIRGNLLQPLLENKKITRKMYSARASNEKLKLIIIANLPYLNKSIYAAAPHDVKHYEPGTALYSPQKGLAHYKKLFSQIKKFMQNSSTAPTLEKYITVLVEISPEQKTILDQHIQYQFPRANVSFLKDFSGQWRVGICTLFF